MSFYITFFKNFFNLSIILNDRSFSKGRIYNNYLRKVSGLLVLKLSKNLNSLKIEKVIGNKISNRKLTLCKY